MDEEELAEIEKTTSVPIKNQDHAKCFFDIIGLVCLELFPGYHLPFCSVFVKKNRKE